MLAYSLVKDDMNVGDLLKVCGYIVNENDRFYIVDGHHRVLLNNIQQESREEPVIVFGYVKQLGEEKVLLCEKIVSVDFWGRRVFEMEYALSTKKDKPDIKKPHSCHLCKMHIIFGAEFAMISTE